MVKTVQFAANQDKEREQTLNVVHVIYTYTQGPVWSNFTLKVNYLFIYYYMDVMRLAFQ